jgi:hypothetical protein
VLWLWLGLWGARAATTNGLDLGWMGLGQIWVRWARFSYCWVEAGLVQGTKTGSGATQPNPREGEQSDLDLRELGSGESNWGSDLREPRLEEPGSK